MTDSQFLNNYSINIVLDSAVESLKCSWVVIPKTNQPGMVSVQWGGNRLVQICFREKSGGMMGPGNLTPWPIPSVTLSSSWT